MERPTSHNWFTGLLSALLFLATLGPAVAIISANDDAKPASDDATTSDGPKDAKASDDKEKPAVDPTQVPDGDEETLLNYIAALRKLQPEGRTMEEKRANFLTAQKGILAAAEKLLSLPGLSEKTREEATTLKWRTLSLLKNIDAKYADAHKKMAEDLVNGSDEKLAEQARLSLLMGRASSIYAGESEDPQKLAGDVLELLSKSPETGIQVAPMVARVFEMSGNLDQAKNLYDRINEAADGLSNEQAGKNAKRAAEMGLARIDLVGKSPVIEGKVFGGEALDWDQYKGKVVLIDFWATWCGPCVAELPNVKKAYETYHDKGFEVIGISLDNSKEALEKFLEKENIPWVTIFEDDKAQQGFDGAPHVKEFGVNGIPATYLIDRDGKIVSISARGQRLEQQLEKLLGNGE